MIGTLGENHCEIVKIQDLHKGKDWNNKNSREIEEGDFSTFEDWKIKSQGLQERTEKKKTKNQKTNQSNQQNKTASNFLNDCKDSSTSCLDKERELKV